MCLTDRWAAYQFDSAVVCFGGIIENYSQEQINVGGESSPKWVNKYELSQLLTDGFIIGGTGGGEDAPLPVGVDGLIVDEVS